MGKAFTESVLWNEDLLQVEFDYVPSERGKRDDYGVQLEPDWPESIEIIAIRSEDGETWPFVGYDDEKEIKSILLELRREREFDYKCGE